MSNEGVEGRQYRRCFSSMEGGCLGFAGRSRATAGCCGAERILLGRREGLGVQTGEGQGGTCGVGGEGTARGGGKGGSRLR